MHRPATLTTLLVLLAACHGGGPQNAPQPAEHSLSGLAGQHVALLPTYSVHVAPGLGWSIGRPADLQATVDAEIAAALEERGLRGSWVLPGDLAKSFRLNSVYATDPYKLAEEPLRSPSLATDARLPEPLASQVRTLVALHQDVRLVLAPVDFRLEKAGSGGRGVLHLVLIDARGSNVRWIGDVASDTAAAFGPAIAASTAAHLAAILAP
jgi:hypothetical protein